MDEKSIPNFSYVQMSLNLSFTALTELSYLSKARSKEEVDLVSGPPFQFYAVTLQYMFVMEYAKLLEKDYRRFPDQHFASLEKLSLKVLETIGSDYQALHEKNLEELEIIRGSDFFKAIRDKRDKKFGHTDGNFPAPPMSISALTDEEISTGFEHINLLKEVNDRCTSPFDYVFAFQHPDDRTDNFIKFGSVYKRYYYDHLAVAHQKGYTLF